VVDLAAVDSVEEDLAEEDLVEDFSDHVLHQPASTHPEHVPNYQYMVDYIEIYHDRNLLPKLHRDQH
jgi:hypothetical protein